MIPALLIALAAVNILSFALMAVDKQRAKRKDWRIRESTLWIAAACFGAFGAMAGMLLFRHKTQKPAFAIGFPALFAGQILLVIWIGRMLLEWSPS